MKTLVLYYSRSGNTKALAEKKARELGADIEEIVDVIRPNYFAAAWGAIRHQMGEIEPIRARLNEYESIVIMSPVWASQPTPAINSVIASLPPGKKVELVMVSAGGGTKRTANEITKLVLAQGCQVLKYTDLKAHKKNGEVVSKVLMESGSGV